MFEVEDLPPVVEVTGGDEASLIDAVSAATRCENATMARRLAAMAALYNRRLSAVASEDQFQWEVDNWDLVAAELGAAQGISRGRATRLLNVAVTLDDLPKVAAVFAAGEVEYRVVVAVVRAVFNVKPEDMNEIDEILARRIGKWSTLSDAKIVDLIDYWVACVDAVAKRQRNTRDQDRYLGIGPEKGGLAELWGSLRAPDAIALKARCDEIADTACRDDPRTKDQRRADAAGALALGQSQLACLCGSGDCPAADNVAPASPVTIHMVAEQGTVTAEDAKPGYIAGFGLVEAEAVRELAATATVRPVRHPGDAPPEPQYRPSRALAEFVRCRDLTCRFPNCGVAAQFCEIDHTVAWPWGPTHASNLSLKCVHHHLMKTFYVGVGGWNDRQSPDGTIIWTAPTGHTYTTKPGGSLFFPTLAAPTGTLVLPSEPPKIWVNKGLKMPLRKRTRAQSRQARIDYERALNYERISEPPPF